MGGNRGAYPFGRIVAYRYRTGFGLELTFQGVILGFSSGWFRIRNLPSGVEHTVPECMVLKGV